MLTTHPHPQPCWLGHFSGGCYVRWVRNADHWQLPSFLAFAAFALRLGLGFHQLRWLPGIFLVLQGLSALMWISSFVTPRLCLSGKNWDGVTSLPLVSSTRCQVAWPKTHWNIPDKCVSCVLHRIAWSGNPQKHSGISQRNAWGACGEAL